MPLRKLETIVDEHIKIGWRSIAGIAVSSVAGSKSAGSAKDT